MLTSSRRFRLSHSTSQAYSPVQGKMTLQYLGMADLTTVECAAEGLSTADDQADGSSRGLASWRCAA